MGFRRFDGFSGSIPQKFIDNRLPVCPMCGTKKPHWTLDMRMGWVNRYLFKCEDCDCIISATVPDVTGIGRTNLTTLGLVKTLSGKNVKTIYMKIDEVGKMQVTKTYEGQEMDLTELISMAEQFK